MTTIQAKEFLISHYNKENTSTLLNDWKKEQQLKMENITYRSFSHTTLGMVYVTEENNNFSITNENNLKFLTLDDSEIIQLLKNPSLLEKAINNGLNIDHTFENGQSLLSYCIENCNENLIQSAHILLDNEINLDFSHLISYKNPLFLSLQKKQNLELFILPILTNENFELLNDSYGESNISIIYSAINRFVTYSKDDFNLITDLFLEKGYEKNILKEFETQHGYSTDYLINFYQQNPNQINSEHPHLVYLIKNEKLSSATKYYTQLNINPTTIKIDNQSISSFFVNVNNDLLNTIEHLKTNSSFSANFNFGGAFESYDIENEVESDDKKRFYSIQSFLNEIKKYEPKKQSNSPLLKKKRF